MKQRELKSKIFQQLKHVNTSGNDLNKKHNMKDSNQDSLNESEQTGQHEPPKIQPKERKGSKTRHII